MDPQPGSSFGPYRIVAPLGRGGMASVYRALDPALDRQVALKVLPPEFLHDPAFAERFRQEARVAARLEHPHVVPIHAFGIDDGRPWMAMRLVTGGSLAQRLQRGPLAPRELAALLRDVAGALDYAHARGVVHRDVKPANVLLDESGRAYLADFGIAKILEASSVATATGMVQGTPSYMAPEQAMGSRVDGAADVYALGVVAFECLTGRVPYGGTTPVAILMKHVQEPVPEPTAAEATPPVAAVLRRCLAKAPDERWPSAGAFADALDAAAAGVTPQAPLPTLELEATPAATPRVPPGPSVPPLPRRRGGLRWALAGGIVALVALVLAGRVLLSSLTGGAVEVPTPAPPTSVSPTATPPPTPTPTPRSRVGAATAAGLPTAAPPPATARPADATPAAAAAADASASVAPTPAPAAPAAPAAPRSGLLRVYCEAKLEPVLFKKAKEKDVRDSLEDLLEALGKRKAVEIVSSRAGADAVVQVLERGREPAVIGMRKLRVRVVLGRESVELTGQDGMTGFNTWSGAANGAAKQIETWLRSRP